MLSLSRKYSLALLSVPRPAIQSLPLVSRQHNLRPYCFRFDLSRLDEMEDEIAGHLDSSNHSAMGDMAQYYRAMIEDHNARDEVDQALAVYKDMKPQNLTPDTITFDSLIAMCARHYRSKDALDVYSDIKSRQLKPSCHLLRTLILMYCDMEHGPDALSLVYDLKDWFYPVDKEIYLALIELLAKQRMTKDAKAIFSDWKSEGSDDNLPNARAYHCLIEMYAGLGQDANALALLKEMEETRKLTPIIETFIALLQMHAQLGQWNESRAFYSRALERANKLGEGPVLGVVYNAMLRSFTEREMRVDAEEIWREMKQREAANAFAIPLTSYHALITCYAKLGDLVAAVALFNEVRVDKKVPMSDRKSRADSTTYFLLIEWQLRSRRISEASALHAELMATGMSVNESDTAFHVVRQRIEQMIAKEEQAKLNSS